MNSDYWSSQLVISVYEQCAYSPVFVERNEASSLGELIFKLMVEKVLTGKISLKNQYSYYD